MSDLGLPFGAQDGNQEGLAVSGDGRFIVGYMDQSELDDSDGFLWTIGSTPLLLTGSGARSAGLGITDSGSVVAGWYWPNGAQLFAPALWRLGTGWTVIAQSGEGSAITPDGSVVVGRSNDRAFRWTQATGLVPLSTGFSSARAVSNDGQIVVGISSPGQSEQPFQWTTQTGIVLLGHLPGGSWPSGALGVSADGFRIVGYGTGSAGAEAFVYEPTTGMRSLRQLLIKQHGLSSAIPSGRTLYVARGVSGDGTIIVGTSSNSQLEYRAFVARLPRCPGDYNRDGSVTPADVTAFVTAWFQSLIDGTDWGDFDLDGAVTPADVAAFVKAWWVLVTTGSC